MAALLDLLAAAYRLADPLEVPQPEGEAARRALSGFLAQTATVGRAGTGAEFDFVLFKDGNGQAGPPIPADDLPPSPGLCQRRSERAFAPRRLRTDEMENLLAEAFPPDRSPAKRRSYPSAGGTYPIELFGISLGAAEGASQLLYFDFERARFEALPGVIPTDDARRILLDLIPADGEPYGAHFENPQFALAYVVHKGRALARYGARGARFAMMEVGAVYQQVGLAAAKVGVGSCLFGATPDTPAMRLLQLEPEVYGYCATHVFGHLL